MRKNTEPGWNLFAVELERLLGKHGATISSLEYRGSDPERWEKRVNGAVVERLKASLSLQGQFPVLNSRDLENVVEVWALNLKEKRHLLAAIVATGVQAKFTPRIKARAAREAAYAILPIIEKALNDDDGALGGIILKGTSPMIHRDGDVYTQALAFIDKGNIALHALDLEMPANFYDAEQSALVQESVYAFEKAITLLDSLTVEQRGRYPDWEYWHAEAEYGKSQVSKG